MTLRKKVIKKLKEYGIKIFNDYEIKNENEYIFYVEDMILFVNDKENYISITFQVTTKPERSATLALILNQIKSPELHIMEPFIFNTKNEFVSGEKAYKLIKNTDRHDMLNEYQKQKNYTDILMNSKKLHEC